MVDHEQDISQAKSKVLGLIDRAEVARIACDLVDIPSPTGFEQACADYITRRYRSCGMSILPQSFDEGRSNAIGVIKGRGEGPVLMLNGHMDTSYTGAEEHMPDLPGYKPKAVVDGDWIYGLGVYNMKGSLACFLHAAECVQRAGIELRGDLIVACVAGEIEKGQVDKYQGALYRGGGCGTWYAITHGALADFAVVGEPSSLSLMRAHSGYVWTKITLTGDPMHTMYGTPEQNTINNMMKLAHAIQGWGNEYEKRRAVYDMPAHVTLSAIEGGWPYRCSRVPVYCTLYVDTRLLPGQEPIEVQREIEHVVSTLRDRDTDLAKLKMKINVFMNQWGSECTSEQYIWKAITNAHEEVMGSPIEVIARPVASDACELVAHGIPSLNYGATGRTRGQSRLRSVGDTRWNPGEGEHANIDDLLKGTKVYASLIVDVLSRTREEIGIPKRTAM